MNIQPSSNRPQVKKVQSDRLNTQNQKGDQPGDQPQPQPVDGFSRGLNTTYNLMKNTGMFVFGELSEAGKNDPALGMRLFATTVSDKLLEGVDDGVRGGFEKAIVPTIRAGLLGLNGYRAYKTFKDPNSHWAQKGLDGLRVATDLVGLAGGLLKVASPAHAALGESMMGYAYAADTVSHAIRTLEHGSNRLKVWKANARTKQEGGGGQEPPQA